MVLDKRPMLTPEEMRVRLNLPSTRWFHGSKREPAPALKAGLKLHKIGGYIRCYQSDFEAFLVSTEVPTTGCDEAS